MNEGQSTCQDVRQKWIDYSEKGSLSKQEKRDLAATYVHLSTCGDCRVQVQHMLEKVNILERGS